VTDVRAAKRALARLADPAPVTAADRALHDLDRAAAFRESGGLDRLRHLVDRGDGPRARRARAALAAFERFERAAAGDPVDGDHFRRGRDSHLPGGG
jgi:hypothetical protein